MTPILLSALHGSRRKPLAACVASIFALTAPTATFATTVTSCADDGGGGTLRSAIAAAAEGGTVDFMAELACVNSTITLSDSAIPITQNSLTIDGPGPNLYLTINAASLPRSYADSRVFTHSGAGTLTINNLALYGGYVYHHLANSDGGCLFSAGNVILNSSVVKNCVAKNHTPYTARGGAIFVNGNLLIQNYSAVYYGFSNSSSVAGAGVYVKGDMSLYHSSINHNFATASTGASRGGGAFVNGNLTLQDSFVTYSSVTSSGASGVSRGGGAYIIGNLTVQSSFVKHNSATGNGAASSYGGGAYVKGGLILDAGVFLNNSVSSGDVAKGGGAYVVGNLNALNSSGIGYNSATTTGVLAMGGGVFAKGDLTLQASTVFHNAVSGGFLESEGGGAYVRGNSAISYTSVTYNNAGDFGGGLLLIGTTNTIASSTISNNTAHDFGGVCAFGNGASSTFELKNSTISSNHAAGTVGGIVVETGTAKLFNSTISFNTAGSTQSGNISPGINLSGDNQPVVANLQSMLISNNSVGSYQLDMTAYPGTVTINVGALAISANNLIRATKVASLPTDTKQGVCPHLGPLRDNGGLTFTHALLSHSPAIDTGSDSFLLAPYDQRGSVAVNGTASYARNSGSGFLTDIGAYEVQQNDIVFNTDFDDCPPLSF